jgi:prepilin peptidase CpaA
MGLPQVAALVVAFLGCITDLKSRKLPNVLTFGAAAGALGYHVAAGGWPGLGWSALGWLVGAAMFFPIFLLRGIGAGDVKLLAALGAWLGPMPAVWLALFTAIAGGPLALIVALSRGYARTALSNIWGLLAFWRAAGFKPHPGITLDVPGAPRLPYALPIAAGLVLTLWLR